MKEPLISTLVEKKAPFRNVRSGSFSYKRMRTEYPGMESVVTLIKELIENYRGQEFVRHKALAITSHIEKDARTGHPDRRNFDNVATAIHDFVVQHVQYVRDQNGIERIQTPDATLRLKTGDCDDMVILSGVLLESLGVPTRIKLIGEGQAFTHIYLEYASPSGQWKSFDPTLAMYPGYVIPNGNINVEKTVNLKPAAKKVSRKQPGSRFAN